MAMRGRNLMGGRNPGRAKAIQQALREALSGGATGGMAGGMRPRKRPNIANMMGEAGKTISDADRQRAMDRAGMLQALEAGEMGMGMSDADLAMLRKKLGMMGGGAVMRYKKGGAVKKTRTKKPKNGCTMKGRGGKYKGMK
jgi:hypothetical protein